jgi:hypothetical protein
MLLPAAAGSAATGPRRTSEAYGAYVLGRLAEASGFGGDVRLCRGPVAYAQAVVIDDRELIFYNGGSLDALERGTGTPWSAVSVIAHELGHHYYGHAEAGLTGVPAEEILQCELDADYFSGYVLALVGASLADAQAAQRTLGADETESHPASAGRLRAIEAGWRDARSGLPIAQHPGERIDCMPTHFEAPAEAPLVAREPLSVEAGRW